MTLSALSVVLTYVTLAFPLRVPLPSWSGQTWLVLAVIASIIFLLLIFDAVYRYHMRTVAKLNTDLIDGKTRETDLTNKVGKLKDDIQTLEIMCKFRDEGIADLEEKGRALQSELDKLKTRKLRFGIDAHRSMVNVVSYYDEQYSVVLRLYIRFENSDVHPLTVKKVKVLLIKSGEDGTESELPLIAPDLTPEISQELYEALFDKENPLAKSEYKWGDRNLSIEARHQTPFHVIEGRISGDGNYRKILDSNCFLRVTMDGMNQPPYSLDFDVEWERIQQGWVHLTPRK